MSAPKTHRIEVGAFTVTTRTPRRFVVIRTRPEAVTRPDPITQVALIYVAFAEVEKRTDSIEAARTMQRRFGSQWGARIVIFDTATGEFV